MNESSRPTRSCVERIAKLAGECTLKHFAKGIGYVQKENFQGIVTAADIETEKLIREEIGKQFPQHLVMGEEEGLDAGNGEKTFLWVVDPIDGTNNFAKGLPYYAVSIGVGIWDPKKDTFEPIVGVVYHPPVKEMFSADDSGAYRNGVTVNPDSFRPQLKLSDSLVVTGFSSSRGEEFEKNVRAIKSIQPASLALRIQGAAALDLIYTAVGTYNVFYERGLKPWDIAAGGFIAEKCGLKVTNFKGEKVHYLKDPHIIVAQEEAYKELFTHLSKVFF